MSQNKSIKMIGTGLLNFFMLGLGHISCGKIKRGIVFYLIAHLIFIIAILICVQPIAPFNVVIAALLYLSTVIYIIVDSVLIARIPDNSLSLKPIKAFSLIIGILLVNTYLIQPTIQGIVKHNFIEAFKIPSGAMQPTVKIGDQILVNKFIYKNNQPKHGDISIFTSPKNPSQDFIKRIVAIAGDTIEMKEKQLFINNIKQNEDYIIHSGPEINESRDNFGPYTVPENSFFALGDNRDNSFDSRFFGVVELSKLKGKTINIYWSWDQNTKSVRWNRIGKAIN